MSEGVPGVATVVVTTDRGREIPHRVVAMRQAWSPDEGRIRSYRVELAETRNEVRARDLASEVRGLLADAYLAGVADGRGRKAES